MLVNKFSMLQYLHVRCWLGSQVGLACWTQDTKGPGFKSQQTVHIYGASVHQAAKYVTALLRVARVTAGLAESNGSQPPGLWLVTARLTAKNRDQLWNPTLGSRVWANFFTFAT